MYHSVEYTRFEPGGITKNYRLMAVFAGEIDGKMGLRQPLRYPVFWSGKFTQFKRRVEDRDPV
jgi:hypothetical protein